MKNGKADEIICDHIVGLWCDGDGDYPVYASRAGESEEHTVETEYPYCPMCGCKNK